LLKNDAAHGLTVSLPNRDKLTMRFKPLKSLSPHGEEAEGRLEP
jgi:hypothetical protein